LISHRSRNNSRDSEVLREKAATEVFITLFPHDLHATLMEAEKDGEHNGDQISPPALLDEKGKEISWSDSEPEGHNCNTQSVINTRDVPLVLGSSHSHVLRPAPVASMFCSPTCQIPRMAPSCSLVPQEQRKRSIVMEHYPPSAKSPLSTSPLKSAFDEMLIDDKHNSSEFERSPMQISNPSPPCSPSKRAKGSLKY